MPTIGTDCDLTLCHPDVDGGAECGFLLERGKAGGLIEIQREAYYSPTGATVDRVRYFFRSACGEKLRLPNGQFSELTRQQWYDKALAILTQRQGITLKTARGEHTELHATLQFLNEEQTTERYDVLAVALNNGGFNEFVPIDLRALNASIYDSGILWDLGYWR